MTDETETQPMDDTRNDHPDEGTIHAWLDGALDEPTAHGIAAHVDTCGECAERVAEARGLIAGASRVVRALDVSSTSPGTTWGQVTAAVAANRPAAGKRWRALRVTPVRAAIAATLLVALGVTFTSTRTAVETDATRMTSMRPVEERAEDGSAATAAAPSLPTRDAVLDSAIARNVAEAQPSRAVGAASTPAVPSPAPSTGTASGVADPAASARVAAGRGAVQAQRDSAAGFAADQLASSSAERSRRAVVGAVAMESARGGSASRATSPAMASTRADVATAAPAPAPAPAPASTAAAAASAASPAQMRRRVIPGPRECYLVERATAGPGAWGPVSLPFVVAVDADGRSARILTADGAATDATATLSRGGNDSLFLRLARAGYQGTLDVGAVGSVRAGVMRSAPVQTGSEAVAASGATARSERETRAGQQVAVAKSAPSRNISTPPSSQNEAIIMPATSIVARLVGCQG